MNRISKSWGWGRWCGRVYIGGGGGWVGYFHQNRTWMCLPDMENLTISIPFFLPNFPLINIPFSKKKPPNFDQIGCFLQYLAQNTPNLCNLGSFISDENSPIAIPNFAKSEPKGRHIYVYHVNVRTSLGVYMGCEGMHGCIHC